MDTIRLERGSSESLLSLPFRSYQLYHSIDCFSALAADEWFLQDESVLEKLAELLVPEEKRGRLECRTRGLDYLDKA